MCHTIIKIIKSWLQFWTVDFIQPAPAALCVCDSVLMNHLKPWIHDDFECVFAFSGDCETENLTNHSQVRLFILLPPNVGRNFLSLLLSMRKLDSGKRNLSSNATSMRVYLRQRKLVCWTPDYGAGGDHCECGGSSRGRPGSYTQVRERNTRNYMTTFPLLGVGMCFCSVTVLLYKVCLLLDPIKHILDIITNKTHLVI